MAPRILLVHPRLAPPGGGEGVGAWLLEGLLSERRYQVELVSDEAPDFHQLDRYYGTRLASIPPPVLHVAPPHLFRIARIATMPGVRGAWVRLAILQRWTRELARRRGPFDLYISTANEWSFPAGTPAIWYIHYPRFHPRRGSGEIRWFHRIPGLLALYGQVIRRVSRFDAGVVRRTVAMANSGWTARRFQEAHGAMATVLHPPVADPALPGVPWSQRANRILLIGRIAPEKRVLEMIEVVRRVRSRLGPTAAPTLELIGTLDIHESYNKTVCAVAARDRDWITLSLDASRLHLARSLSENRFGLHGMREEHFGVAVAELQGAGCVAFVPATGGPPEIIGPEPRQLYSSDDEAVEKMVRVASDPALQQALHERARQRSKLFTAAHFRSAFLDHIDQVLSSGRVG